MQHNGVNLLSLFGKDALAYGRILLDQLFTKEEQRGSLFHKTHTTKSTKSTLDQAKVDILFGESLICIRRTYFVDVHFPL